MCKITFSVFLAGCLVGTMSCQHDPEPSQVEAAGWGVYSEGSEIPHLAAGKCVLVFVYPELHQLSLPALNALTDAKLRKLCKEDTYIKLLLKYNAWNDMRLHHIVNTIGFTKKPFVVRFSPDGKASAFDPLTLDELDLKKEVFGDN